MKGLLILALTLCLIVPDIAGVVCVLVGGAGIACKGIVASGMIYKA